MTSSLVATQRLSSGVGSTRCSVVPRPLVSCVPGAFKSHPSPAISLAPYTAQSPRPTRQVVRRAFEQGSGPKDPSVENLVEVKVDSVRVSQGASVVYLRLLDGSQAVLPVHIGRKGIRLLEILKARDWLAYISEDTFYILHIIHMVCRIAFMHRCR